MMLYAATVHNSRRNVTLTVLVSRITAADALLAVRDYYADWAYPTLPESLRFICETSEVVFVEL